jgi:hypothetical protein
MDLSFIKQVWFAADKRFLFLRHALSQMTRPDRMIETHEVRNVVYKGELIEDYPEDPRGHSCLILGFGQNGRALHVCCAPKDEYLSIITAYIPDQEVWSNDLKTRVKK